MLDSLHAPRLLRVPKGKGGFSSNLELDALGPQEVDLYKAAKLREGALGPNQINKTIGLLAAILDTAGDDGGSRATQRRGLRTRLGSTST